MFGGKPGYVFEIRSERSAHKKWTGRLARGFPDGTVNFDAKSRPWPEIPEFVWTTSFLAQRGY